MQQVHIAVNLYTWAYQYAVGSLEGKGGGDKARHRNMDGFQGA